MNNKKNGHEVLLEMIEGNKRFTSGLRSVQSIGTAEKLNQLALEGQKPSCIILSCSDSRVPAEMIFDQGLGDLFVIRVAGNVVAPSLLASMEFAALNFSSSLILVLGHTRCGAIHAACTHHQNPGQAGSKNLEDLIKRITPAVKNAKPSELTESLIREATRLNVRNSISEIINNSSIISEKILKGEIVIAGALFELESGRVIVDERPVLNPSSDLPRLHVHNNLSTHF